MGAQATVTLNTLHCIEESDRAGTGGSEPYVWPFMATTALRPFTFHTFPTAPSVAESRKVIRDSMKAGQSADLEGPFNRLVATFQDDQYDEQLILVVALLEDDGTDRRAMTAGYQAFVDGLRDGLQRDLGAFVGATPAERAQLVEELKTSVKEQVRSAIAGELSTFQKLFGAKDDFLAADFRFFQKPMPQGNTPFRLQFRGVSGDAPKDRDRPVAFTLDGTLAFFTSDVHGPIGGGVVIR